MASVTYKIGGKYDGKGIKSATKDLSALANVVKGLAVVKIASQLNKIAQSTKGVFVEQNKALTSFNVSVAKSGIEISKLNNLKKQLSHGNFIDDDSINNAMQLGLQMGLNEKQLEKVMKASTELQSAGVMPLDQAVKSLSQSYGGNVSQLAKLDPSLKNLTKTQLANGDAVDILLKKYDGFSDALSNTFAGRDTQWKNSISDLQASIGGIFKSFEFISQGKLMQPLQDLTQWLVDNRNKIINFFLNLPQIFKVVVTEFINMGKRTFEYFPDWISSVGVYFVDAFKDGFRTMFNIAKETFNGMMTLLDFAIGNPFRSSKNFINTMLNNLIEGINGLADKLPEWTKKLFGIEKGNAITFRFETGQNDLNKTWTETAKKIENSMKGIIKAYKDGSAKTKEDWLKVFNASKEFYQEDIDALKEKLTKILGQDLPSELQMALDGLTFTGATGTTTTDGITTTTSKSNAKSIGTTVISNTGEIGSIVQSVINNGIWGAIAEIIAKLLQRVEEVVPIFQILQNVVSEIFDVIVNENTSFIQEFEEFLQPFLNGFDALKDIISGFLELIAGILNAFTPIFEGFTMILNKIAPIITSILELLGLIFKIIGVVGEMLNPILEVILNVIAPVLDIINQIIKAVYRIIANIVNVVIDIYNKISWGNKISHIDTEMKSTSSPLSGYSNTSSQLATQLASTTSNSASYTAGKDIYVTINFANSYVNGDAREIALMLRDEIRSAERLGY